jgi:ABC-2 type transport system permease protein
LNSSLFGYLLIKNGGSDSVSVQFRSAVMTNPEEIYRFEKSFNDARIITHLGRNLTSEEEKIFSGSAAINSVIIEDAGRESDSDFTSRFFSSLVLIMLLLMIIISIGGMLIRSILEEKSNRLIEILLSSCTPEQLLSGKIYGLSALGFTQILVWSALGFLFSGTSLLPPDVFNNILPMLLFFVLGFLFYTSVYVGIGSIVTTEQEAQQVNGYLSILLFLPIVFALPAIQNPESLFVKVLSFIPFTSPTIMLFRFNTGPIPLWETITTTIVMIVSIMLTIMITSRIFKIGILSYGKRPSFKEIRQWLSETS